MNPDSSGIPNLPDLTHPEELLQFGGQILSITLMLLVLTGFLGVTIALLSFALRRDDAERQLLVGTWVIRYSSLLRALQHGILIVLLLVSGFFLCSTLSNRYHHWEQARITQIAATVSGDRLEQRAPQVRYVVQESYTYTDYTGGKANQVEATRDVNRFLTLSSSQVQVKLNQATNPQDNRSIYQVNFTGDYEVVNLLDAGDQFFFEAPPPEGYTLLQGFRVERDGTRLEAVNPGDFGFPFRLQPRETARFRVTYQAQGAPRWVYNAQGQLLSNFRLTAHADFPGADFASGIVPTESKDEGRGTVFTWTFNDNVSVQNPFGVFTATAPVRNTGVMPRLLLLAPGILLWWLVLLYLSVPLRLQDVIIAAGVFFACLLSLTYLSRLIDVRIAWGWISIALLCLSWGLGQNRRNAIAALICTIAGAVFPVLALIVPYSGLTLSFAALLSVGWLVIQNWYGFYRSDRPLPRS